MGVTYRVRFMKRVFTEGPESAIVWLACVLDLDSPPRPDTSFRVDGWESGPARRVVWDGDEGEYRVYVRDGEAGEGLVLDWFSAWFRIGWRRIGSPWRCPRIVDERGARSGDPRWHDSFASAN